MLDRAPEEEHHPGHHRRYRGPLTLMQRMTLRHRGDDVARRPARGTAGRSRAVAWACSGRPTCLGAYERELVVSRKIVFLVGTLLVLAIYGVAVAVMVTTPGINSIPTPGKAVVAAIIAMFSTLGIFVLGFIQTATVSED